MLWFPQYTLKLSFFSFVDECVFSRLTIKIELLGWMKKCFIHSQIWDGMMNCDIYIERERERKKKEKPIQIWFSWMEMLWFLQDTQIQLLGWMEKCFIHPQIWDEMMECGIYIYTYI